MRDLPVIIVGAGPVGLIAALRLARQGLPVVLLEARAALARDLRASTLHPPTLEMLDELDLTGRLLEVGLKVPSWQIRMHETGERAEFNLAVIAEATRYPFRLQAEQAILCEFALELARSEPTIDIRLGHEVCAFYQFDDRIEVEVRVEGHTERISGSWLLAADGGRSTIRKQLGLKFDGLTYPEQTILVTTHFPFEDHLEGLSHVNYVWYREGTFSLLRLPDIWRCSLYPDAGESMEEALTSASVERKLQRIVPRDEPYRLEEVRPYRIHQRILDEYVHGRVIFLGDAAHLNSPSGGMGMNGGIHDAVNLTDKLPKIWRGEADCSLLQLYSRQRQPVARKQILQQAHRNRTRMQERDPQARRRELTALQDVAADIGKAREFLLRSSMITGLREAAAVC
ncbi:MAG: FAD-dependent monooxygenase [Chromatocurvus sp.]